MSNSEDWSFEDEVFKGMTEEQIRRIPAKNEHSIAWLIWHLARPGEILISEDAYQNCPILKPASLPVCGKRRRYYGL